LDWEKCEGTLVLRNWRPGDSYTSSNRPGPEIKIKTLFQENRIPLWERRTWPVIVQAAGADSILWTRQFGVAEEFAATPASQQILSIREVRGDAGESNVPAPTSKQAERARMKNPVSRGQGPDERGAEVL
jgi:tRNA(Ile)-lysidine synthetase-like protein